MSRIRMPSQEELPPGPRRRFMEVLYRLWSEAGLPTPEKVSARIIDLELRPAVSRETIRKMLKGETVPYPWERAENVFLALSDTAGTNPDRLVVYFDDGEGYVGAEARETARAVFKRIWTKAYVESDYAHGRMEDYTPPTRGGGFGGDAFSDEPPF